jgi:hypothetical protein
MVIDLIMIFLECMISENKTLDMDIKLLLNRQKNVYIL